MINKELMKGKLHTLAGFISSSIDGTGVRMNFVFSNGDISPQHDKDYPTNYKFVLPSEAINRIRSITIYFWPGDRIRGFSLFDKDGALLLNIGYFKQTMK